MKLTKNEMVRIRFAAECILNDFIWNDTSQGEDYLLDVRRNLIDLVGGVNTKIKKKRKKKK